MTIGLTEILIRSNSVKPSTTTAIAVMYCCGAFFLLWKIKINILCTQN